MIETIVLTCPQCGKQFETHKRNKRFCSRRCNHSFATAANRRRRKLGLPAPEKKLLTPEERIERQRESRRRAAQVMRERKKLERQCRVDAVVARPPVKELSAAAAAEVERVMHLPPAARWQYSQKWGRAERSYAKRIYDRGDRMGREIDNWWMSRGND